MAFRKIVKFPSAELKKKSVPVDKDEDVSTLVGDLWDTINVSGGVGLSAPQIGIHKRVIYVACPEYKGEMINPVITEPKGLNGQWEGCLSFPGVREIIPRYDEINVTFQKLNGDKEDIVLSGLPAQIVQHEVDHLDGKLMTDYFHPFKRQRIAKQVRKVTGKVKSIMKSGDESQSKRVRKTAHLSKKELKKRRKHRRLSR